MGRAKKIAHTEEAAAEVQQVAKPLLKWAGGKTQLLEELLVKVPMKFGTYIEPFFGGGALFFALRPEKAIIADSNPELVNLYQAVADNYAAVLAHLETYKNNEKFFYALRAKDWTKLEAAEAAARTIFLNRTCFNGLYRVNKKGQFNVPFGRYTNPKIADEASLKAASLALQKATIICEDYKDVLKEHTKAGDFVFLDPPYLPISAYADFKRYTKEQFYEEDHEDLSKEVLRLHNLGCNVVLTNSNHHLVHEQYKDFPIKVVKTKRYISCNGSKREGEDVIVTIPPKIRFDVRLVADTLPTQVHEYPSTRYMGSKSKLLSQIWSVASQFSFERAVDLFSGSGAVGYMLKTQGIDVTSNDYMAMSAVFSKAMIENNDVTLNADEILQLLSPVKKNDHFVESTFKGLYFADEDNKVIDVIRQNIKTLSNPSKRAIAMSALIRACLKKRPRGIFTYVGYKYDDGRKDLTMSFEQQFIDAVEAVNNAVFDNGTQCKSRHGDAMTFKNNDAELVYIDPPYYSPLSDNEYVRRYHFVEGLARDWKDVEIQKHTITKKFKSYPTPFSTKTGAAQAFDLLFKRFKDSVLIVSYSSNSEPSKDEMIEIMSRHKKYVDLVPVDYKYSFGNQGHKVGSNKNSVQEYLFVGH